MAKKDISKFQKALFSKTKVIKESLPKEIKTPVGQKEEENATASPQQQVQIVTETFPFDPVLMKKMEELSKKHDIELEALVNFAIKFFLDFEDELF